MRLLLDEHISPAVADALSSTEIEVVAVPHWQGGTYREADDDTMLRAAYAHGWVVVTYDQRTIPPLLKAWGEQGIPHGGVVFVDERTIAPNDIGGLVRALRQLASSLADVCWENRVVYLKKAN